MKIRKASSLFVLMLITATGILSAQPEVGRFHEAPVSVGLKGGLNISNVINTEVESPRSLRGLMLGISFDINLPGYPFGLESGVFYSNKGMEFTEENVRHTLKLNYLEVPLAAKYSFNLMPFYPHLLLGPYMGFENTANLEIKDMHSNNEFVEDIGNSINSVDYGGVVGAGVEFFAGRHNVSLQAKYSLGLNDIYKQKAVDTEEVPDDRHSVFYITLGISL